MSHDRIIPRPATYSAETEGPHPMLESMLTGYIACALWSSTDDSNESGGNPMDDNYDECDIAPETLATMREDCADFLSACGEYVEAGPGDASQAGHDFWLTRCGHGTGFWDRGDNVWPKPARDAMASYSRAAGNVDLYIGDDGKVHA